jgi:dTDP-4-dehydrorhamnose reductase
MLSLFQQKKEIGVVGDQFGQPTNANDFAEVIMQIITTEKKEYGVFHYSNYPETTWYQFAKKITEFSQSSIIIKPITTADYPTPAKRPMRSTFCLDKIENCYDVEIKYWEHSLQNCINILLETNKQA